MTTDCMPSESRKLYDKIAILADIVVQWQEFDIDPIDTVILEILNAEENPPEDWGWNNLIMRGAIATMGKAIADKIEGIA